VGHDGAGGDQRAGDGVWSATATFAPGTRVSYVYTNSGARGRWEGLDIPHLRSVVIPAPARSGPATCAVEYVAVIRPFAAILVSNAARARWYSGWAPRPLRRVLRALAGVGIKP